MRVAQAKPFCSGGARRDFKQHGVFFSVLIHHSLQIKSRGTLLGFAQKRERVENGLLSITFLDLKRSYISDLGRFTVSLRFAQDHVDSGCRKMADLRPDCSKYRSNHYDQYSPIFSQIVQGSTIL